MSSTMPPLVVAAREGNADVLRVMLRTRAGQINMASPNGETPLLAVAFAGHADLVTLLIAAGANTESRMGTQRVTPLITASMRGHAHTVAELLARGALLEPVDSRGWNALHTAAFEGHEEAVRALLFGGAVLGRRTSGGESALGLATFGRRAGVCKMLLAAGATVAFTEPINETFLSPMLPRTMPPPATVKQLQQRLAPPAIPPALPPRPMRQFFNTLPARTTRKNPQHTDGAFSYGGVRTVTTADTKPPTAHRDPPYDEARHRAQQDRDRNSGSSGKRIGWGVRKSPERQPLYPGFLRDSGPRIEKPHLAFPEIDWLREQQESARFDPFSSNREGFGKGQRVRAWKQVPTNNFKAVEKVKPRPRLVVGFDSEKTGLQQKLAFGGTGSKSAVLESKPNVALVSQASIHNPTETLLAQQPQLRTDINVLGTEQLQTQPISNSGAMHIDLEEHDEYSCHSVQLLLDQVSGVIYVTTTAQGSPPQLRNDTDTFRTGSRTAAESADMSSAIPKQQPSSQSIQGATSPQQYLLHVVGIWRNLDSPFLDMHASGSPGSHIFKLPASSLCSLLPDSALFETNDESAHDSSAGSEKHASKIHHDSARWLIAEDVHGLALDSQLRGALSHGHPAGAWLASAGYDSLILPLCGVAGVVEVWELHEISQQDIHRTGGDPQLFGDMAFSLEQHCRNLDPEFDPDLTQPLYEDMDVSPLLSLLHRHQLLKLLLPVLRAQVANFEQLIRLLSHISVASGMHGWLRDSQQNTTAETEIVNQGTILSGWELQRLHQLLMEMAGIEEDRASMSARVVVSDDLHLSHLGENVAVDTPLLSVNTYARDLPKRRDSKIDKEAELVASREERARSIAADVVDTILEQMMEHLFDTEEILM